MNTPAIKTPTSKTPASKTVATKTPSPHKPTREPQSILVVEDDVATAQAVGTILVGAGFVPAVFTTAADALRHVDGARPAVAVVDLHLTDLSGLILAQKLREQFGAGLPIIIVSGDSSMETLNSLSHAGVTYFFSKPLNPALLIGRIEQCLA